MDSRTRRLPQSVLQRPLLWAFAVVMLTLLPLPALAQKAYIPNSGTTTVTVINTLTGAVCTTSTCVSTATYPISVGTHPSGVAVSPDGTRAYVTNTGSNTVSVINTSTDAVTATISVGGGPVGIAELPNQSAVYAVNNTDGTVSVIDTSTNSVTATITLPRGGSTGIYPGGIAASSDNSTVYVVTGSGLFEDGTAQLIAIDTTSHTPTGHIVSLGFGPFGLALSLSGSQAFVGAPAGLLILNTSTGAISSTVSLGSGVAGKGVALSPDGSTVYVSGTGTSGAGTLSIVQGTTVLTSVSVGHGPAGVSLTTGGNRVYVVNQSDNTVSVVSTAGSVIGSAISVGSSPNGLGVFIQPPSPISGKQLGPNTCSCQPNRTVVDANGTVYVAEPIDVGSGNVSYKATDYTTSGQNPLAFTRYYNSRANIGGISTFAGTLGVNWRHSFDHYLQIVSSSKVIAERATGRQYTFTLSGSTWTPDSDVDIALAHSGSNWTLTDPDDTVETYTTTTAGNEALLNSIALRNGYTQTLTHNTSNQLASVSDSYSRSFSLTYNTDGTLYSVSTPDSTTITFSYTSVTGGKQLTSVTYPTSPASSQTFAYGNSALPFALTSITDETAHTYASWSYDASGRGLTSQLGSGANLTTLVYSASSTKVTNALGVADTYTFSTLQGLPKVTQISRAASSTTAAATETFTYDTNGFLASATDWNGNQTTYTNNSHGLPTTINEAVGSTVARTTIIAYNSTFPHLPDSITAPGVTTSFTYDTSGNVLTRKLTDTTTTSTPYSTNGQTRTWTNTWSNHLLASVKTPRNNTTGFGYDSSGALTSVTDALTHATNITSHTGGGRPLTIVDPNSVTTTLTYDPRQRLLTSSVSTSGGARTTSYTYDAAGNLTKTTLPDSSYIANTFDTAHRITKITDALGNYINYTLDALGDITALNIYDNAGGLYASHSDSFDALGRVLVDTGGRSQTITYSYDANGNTLTIKDGLSHTTTRTVDALNRLKTSTDPSSGVAQFAYDAHDRLITVTDPNSNATSYVRDGFGGIIQQASPDTGTSVYHYDSDGNLTQKVDAASVTMNATYDALDRILTRTYPADTSQNVSFTYDVTGYWPYSFGIGRLSSVTDPAGTVQYGYDERGHAVNDLRTSGTKHFDTYLTYDAVGRVLGISYPSGLWVAWNRDTAGRINSVAMNPPNRSLPGQTVAWLGNNPFGPMDYITYGNGITGPYQLNRDYSINNITLTGTGSATYQNLSYGFDNNDNVTSISDAVTTANSQTLGYDTLNRLTSATSGTGGYGSLTWAYDHNGNLTSRVAGGTTFNYALTSGTNRIATTTYPGHTQTVGYTANGNLNLVAQDGVTSFTTTYNVGNRLASVTGTPLAVSAIVYDGFGQRFSKQNPGSTPNYYSYDLSGHMIEENDNGAITDYIYVNGRPIGLFVPDGTGSGTLYYVHPDRVGAPQFVTNASQGVVWSTTYQPYGSTTIPTGSITQNLRLPGQYFDGDDGFNYNLNRDYFPSWGRYIEADPIGLGGGTNVYAYGNGNPMSFTDPTGTFGWGGAAIGGGAGAVAGYVAAGGGSKGYVGAAVGATAGFIVGGLYTPAAAEAVAGELAGLLGDTTATVVTSLPAVSGAGAGAASIITNLINGDPLTNGLFQSVGIGIFSPIASLEALVPPIVEGAGRCFASINTGLVWAMGTFLDTQLESHLIPPKHRQTTTFGNDFGNPKLPFVPII